MKVSTKGRYGMRLMTALGAHYGQGPISADLLADMEDVSSHYIHVLMSTLRSAGLVRTVRGPNGGYECSEPPHTITALDIVTVLEGEVALVNCTSKRQVCSKVDRCATHHLWCSMAHTIKHSLAQVTLADLVRKQGSGQEPTAMYHI